MCLRTHDFFFSFPKLGSGNAPGVVGSSETTLAEGMRIPAAIPFPFGPLALALSCAKV